MSSIDYTGYASITLSDEELAALYENKSVIGLRPNEYGIIYNKDGEVVDKYCGIVSGIRRVKFHTIGDVVTGVFKPKNIEQELAFDLMNSDTPVKLVTGTWGTGKTLCLCAAAIEQINKGKFDKIVWVRNNIEVKDTTPLGALPGSEWEKLAPFVGPLADHVGGDEGIRRLFDENKLDVVHLG
jgi:predicted ribonuclease YlaK